VPSLRTPKGRQLSKRATSEEKACQEAFETHKIHILTQGSGAWRKQETAACWGGEGEKNKETRKRCREPLSLLQIRKKKLLSAWESWSPLRNRGCMVAIKTRIIAVTMPLGKIGKDSVKTRRYPIESNTGVLEPS